MPGQRREQHDHAEGDPLAGGQAATRRAHSHTLRPMRLATFLPPGGGEPLAGEVRGDDGRRVRRRLDRARPARLRRPDAGGRRRVRARRGRAARARRRGRARSSASASTTPRTRAETGGTLPEAPIVFMKLPTLGRGAQRADQRARGRAAPGLRGRARRRHGRRRRGRGLRGRRRRLGARPAAARAAVDPREGLRRLVPVRPVDHDRRRGSATRTTCALRTWVNGELRQDSRTSDLIFDVPQLVAFLRETMHARARRPDPHRHAQRRRHGDGPAAVPGARRRRADRDRAPRRDRARGASSGPASAATARLRHPVL